ASERRQRASAGPPPVIRRRWLLPAAIVAILALIGVAFVVARPEPTYVPGAGTVARIDGERFDRPIPVGSFPLAITEGEGRMWITDRQSQIYWVQESDDSTGSRGTVGVPTNALDPLTGSVRTSVDVGAQGCNGPASIAINQDGVWVACAISRQVIRIDPSGGTVATSLPVSAAPVALTTGADGSVWVAVQPS